jgi:hypothetical protein
MHTAPAEGQNKRFSSASSSPQAQRSAILLMFLDKASVSVF